MIDTSYTNKGRASMTNNEKLKTIMQDKTLTQKDVSEISGYSLDLVKAWCSDPRKNKRYREMLDRQLRALELEIKERKI